MRIRSFATKLVLSYAAIILASFTATAFFIDKNLEKRSLVDIKASLVTQARLINPQIESALSSKVEQSGLQKLAVSFGRSAECRVTIIDSSGKVLADSEVPIEDVQNLENHLYRPEIRTALSGSIGVDMRRSPTLKIEMLYAAVPIKQKSVITGALRLALSLESVNRTLWATRKIVLGGLIFAIFLSVIIGALLASRVTKPINSMIQASRRFSKGDFSRRIIHISKDEIGELAATLNSMAQDIEDKIAQIKTQNQELEAVFSSMIEGVIIVDSSFRIISINSAIEKTFGVIGSQVKGRVFLEAIRNNDIVQVIDAVLHRGLAVSMELDLAYPVRKNLEINAVPIMDNDQIKGCLAVMHDITEIKRLETIRSDFIANAAHELKTPLTSIKGFVETLTDGAIDDRKSSREFLGIIGEHAERLDSLVNDLLSLSRLESREVSLEKQDIKLRALAEEITQGFGAQLKKKGVMVDNRLPAELVVKADKSKIRQVMTNLFDNAVKFNKEKGLIGIYSEESDNAIKVIVEDSGIGIPAKDIHRIFERFYRVDKARSSDLGGTGLGLSIVKHIIGLHNGSVGVESTEGAGSRFWFTLPI